MSTGRAIKYFRHQLKKYVQLQPMTQKDMANALHVSESVYSHYENDRRQPSCEVLKRIAELMNLATAHS